MGFAANGHVHRNLSIDSLIQKALSRKEVLRSKTGAVVVYTGKYTGRSPNDKFIVDTKSIHDKIHWGKINVPIEEEYYKKLYQKITNYLSEKHEIFIFDGYVGANKKHQLHVRVVCEYAYQALFINQLLIRPTPKTLKNHKPQLTVICAPGCTSDPKTDGTNSEAFIVLNLDTKTVLIGGTKYAGEIKKSIFSVMNYYLPDREVLPMHSSANKDHRGSTALFFGLSGTGKTTLSADTNRLLIGDDEHGWSDEGIFNFEGGCYAKCINLRRESEPLIWDAIRHGALVENAVMTENGEFDFDDGSFTENTRVGYPLDFIQNADSTGLGSHPKTVIFLTADAFGVLPPVAKLTINSAIYHFLSGYTSKLAGTERGVIEPSAAFSAYYGAPFMPRKPEVYANLLKKYIAQHKSDVYLINTGWVGGPYGIGRRIAIKDTRLMVTAALEGKLKGLPFRKDPFFHLNVPSALPGVNPKLLNPRNLWENVRAYDKKAKELATLFVENFTKFNSLEPSIAHAGPKL